MRCDMKYRLLLIGGLTLLLLGLIGAVIGADPARASAVFTVDSTIDEPDASPGDGLCASTPSGVCTLRAAVMEANALTGADTIVLPAGTYTLTVAGTGEDAALTGDLDITGTVTISGTGADSTIIDGGQIDRVLDVLPGATVEQLIGATVRNGNGGIYVGSGVFNRGTLTMTSSGLSANTGCGLYNLGGSAMLTDVLISGNISSNSCGGLRNEAGSMTLTSSRVEYNTYFTVGGILNASDGVLTLVDTTVNGNVTTGGGGGGIRNDGSMTLLNSTVISNSAEGNGGGIYNAGVLTLTDSYILSNTTGSVNSPGGGIYNLYMMTATNSLIQGNLGGGISNLFGSATITSVTIAANIGSGIDNVEGVMILSNSTIISNVSGSGIFNGVAGGTSSVMTVTDSLIVGNQNQLTGTFSTGGGISNGPGGRLSVVNSTISGNTAYANGGGVHNHGLTGYFTQLNLNNVTIANNVADYDGDSVGDGGGIINLNGSILTIVNLGNTIVSGNVDSGNAPDISGTVASQGYNLIQSLTGYTVTGITTGNLMGVNPNLGPLQDNGGPTLTCGPPAHP